MAKSNNERFAAYYQRKKEGVEIPKCKCDRPLKGSLSRKRLLCKFCYEATEDKRHKTWVNANKKRDRPVLVSSLESYGNFKVGGNVSAPDGSVGVIQAIASYIDSSVDAEVLFDDADKDIFLISGLPLINP